MSLAGDVPDRGPSVAGDVATAVADSPPDRRGAVDRLLVWYDGACPLCRREIALMRRLDRGQAIDFVDIAHSDAACPIDRPTMLARFHAREGGQLLVGAAAFAAMWRAIPWLRPIGLAARNTIVLSTLERIYGLFLRIRPTLQRVAARLE